MPHRRVVKKGSFGGHFDELVKQFAGSRASSGSTSDEKAKPKRISPAKLNQALFDGTRCQPAEQDFAPDRSRLRTAPQAR